MGNGIRGGGAEVWEGDAEVRNFDKRIPATFFPKDGQPLPTPIEDLASKQLHTLYGVQLSQEEIEELNQFGATIFLNRQPDDDGWECGR